MIEDTQPSTLARKLAALTVLTLLGIGLVPIFLPIAPLDPDEPLFACVARQMIASQDFVTPSFKGKPFWDRPALPYWLLVCSVRVLGDNDLAYRVPGLILGSGTVLATGLIGRRLFGPTVGVLAALALAMMVGGSVLLLAIGHDSALVFFSSAAIASALRWQVQCEDGASRSKRWGFACLTGILVGFGCLSKGLLGILLPAVAFAGLSLGMKRHVRVRSGLVVLAIAVLIGGSWYLAMEVRNPGFLRYYFYERHMLGFFTTTQRHGGRSVWIYLPTLLVAASPWTILSFPLVLRPREVFRHAGMALRSSPALRGTTLWLAFTVAGFVLAGSRNPTYLLPALPPLALLIAVLLSRFLLEADRFRDDPLTGQIESIVRVLPCVTILAVANVAPVAIFAISGQFAVIPTISALSITSFTAIAYVSCLPAKTINLPRSLYFQATATIGALAMVFGFVLPEVAQERSAASAIAAIRALDATAPRVLWFNHIPPSALYHGHDLGMTRVYIDSLGAPPDRPTVLVARASRLDEVRSTPFVAGARHLDLGGKYHLFLCGDWPAEDLTPNRLVLNSASIHVPIHTRK